MSDYLKLLLEWLKNLLVSQKTVVLATTILGLYIARLLGDIPTNEALLAAIYAAIVAWLTTSAGHGFGKRLGLLK